MIDQTQIENPFGPGGQYRSILEKLSNLLFLLVPGAGLEPARPCGQRILSPLRLPIPPPGLQIKLSGIECEATTNTALGHSGYSAMSTRLLLAAISFHAAALMPAAEGG